LSYKRLGNEDGVYRISRIGKSLDFPVARFLVVL